MLFRNKIKLKHELRDYQQSAVEQIIATDSNQLLVAPTSAGKSAVILALAKHYLEQDKKVLISVQMLIVLNQLIEQCADAGFWFGVIQGNHEKTNPLATLQLASNSTLVKRDSNDYDAILIDEIHNIPKKLHEALCNTTAKVIGFTATPFSAGLHKLFGDNVINLITAKELTERGYLAKLKIISGKKIDTSKLKVVAGQYSADSIQSNSKEVLGDTVRLYEQYASNVPTILFGASIAHCLMIADEFNSKDIPTAVYCADTLPLDKEIIIENFKIGKIKVICSVYAIAVGWDVPEATVMIDCRPLRKAFSIFIQSLGRVLRPHPNKREAILIDCTGNIRRMADDYIDLYENGVSELQNAEKKDKKTYDKKDKDNKDLQQECPECEGNLFIGRRCLSCGHEIPRQRNTDIIHEANAKFEEFDVFSARKGYTNDELWKNICKYVLENKTTDPERAKKMCLAIYKNISGEFPAYNEAIRIHNGEINPQILSKIKKLEQHYWLKKTHGGYKWN